MTKDLPRIEILMEDMKIIVVPREGGLLTMEDDFVKDLMWKCYCRAGMRGSFELKKVFFK